MIFISFYEDQMSKNDVQIKNILPTNVYQIFKSTLKKSLSTAVGAKLGKQDGC